MEYHNIYDIVNEEGLDEKYTDDVSRGVVIFFKEKGISIKDLLLWQKKYPIIYPWDSDYNNIRLNFNRVGQFFPKMIIKISSSKDTQWILQIAIKYNIKFTIRGGGHCSNCYSLCNGIVIDTTDRKYIKFCDNNIVKLGSGVLLCPLIEELFKKNKFIPHGTCNVNITGLSSGGGIGIMRRKYGLTSDNMLSATIILADATIIKTDKNNYSDLFWAIRGGGNGNFGIITDLVFQTHELSKVYLFELWIPFCNFTKAVNAWQRWAPVQTNNLTSFMCLYSPKNKNKKEAIYISGQFDGRKSELKDLLKVFNEFTSSEKIWSVSMLGCEINCFIPNPPLFYFYLNLFAIEYLSIQAIKNLKRTIKYSSVNVSIEIDAMGGKISELSNKSTSFFWRNSLFWILLRAATDDTEELKEPAKWIRTTYNQLLNDGLRNPKTRLPVSYCNFKDPELTKEEYPLVYWGDNADKLSQIKSKYDPNNVFNYSQSIPLQ